MTRQTLRQILAVAIVASAIASGTGVRTLRAQAPKIRYLSGQNIQPAYEGWEYRVIGEMPNTDYVMNNVFWIGTFPGLDKPRLDYMIETLHDAVKPV